MVPRSETSCQHSPLLCPWLQGCPQLWAVVVHRSFPAAGSWHCPLLPLVWFSRPWPRVQPCPAGRERSPCCWRCCHRQPSQSLAPAPSTAAFLSFSFFCFIPLLFFFPFPKQATTGSSRHSPANCSPTPIAPSQPSAPAFLSLGCRDQVWARQIPFSPISYL